MSRSTKALAATLLLVAACGRRNAPDSSADSTLAAAQQAAAAIPKEAHVTYMEIGLLADSAHNLVGGAAHTLNVGDSAVVAVRTQYAKAGAAVAVRVMTGGKTIDSVTATTGEPDTTETSRVSLQMTKSKSWAKGKYQFEVFLDGKSQGIKDFDINP